MSRITLKTSIKSKEGYSRVRNNDLSHWTKLNLEAGGARIKTILNPPNSKIKYLFKVPKYGEFERVTEIFNSILAKELSIRHTEYFPGYLPEFGSGVFCKSFLSDQITEELWEMKELVIRHSPTKALDQLLGRDKEVLKEHNIDNIFLIIDEEFKDKRILNDFFQMISLDALIGHGDRHWSNYGFIVSGKASSVTFSPIYDTASGYLTENSDEKCNLMLNSELNDQDWYMPNMRGLCKITIPGNIKSNHFDLMKYILENPTLAIYKPYLAKAFKNYNPKLLRTILDRFFPKLGEVRYNVIERILNKRWEIGLELLKRYE